jgi:DNA-binding winged helix-turn-helix (wHTH) protein
MAETLGDAATEIGVLTESERAVLAALQTAHGRVIGRAELAARSGLGDLSARRVDSILVGLRRSLGEGSIVTVRARGWRLADPTIAEVQPSL